MITILVILSILLLSSIFVIINLLRKYENVEDDNEYMLGWINKFNISIIHILKRIKDIDRKGLFESDDDVGSIFKELKDLINTLENLVVKTDDK
tara:strand:- start:685 stop:966 length:282 start_codon:yes stop_codon:yes gene_type:complete